MYLEKVGNTQKTRKKILNYLFASGQPLTKNAGSGSRSQWYGSGSKYHGSTTLGKKGDKKCLYRPSMQFCGSGSVTFGRIRTRNKRFKLDSNKTLNQDQKVV
jgi:hypothetical protein